MSLIKRQGQLYDDKIVKFHVRLPNYIQLSFNLPIFRHRRSELIHGYENHILIENTWVCDIMR